MSGSTPADDDYGEDLLYSMACKCEELFDTPISGAVEDKWQELGQRFAIWTSYLGVFARKSQCLDTRLRNAPDIKDLVARLLDVLLRSLNDVIRSYSLLQQSRDRSAESPRDSPEQCLISGLANIDSALTRINRLSIDIKQASRGSIDIKVNQFASRVNLAPFITVAQLAVSSLYPGAQEPLKEHLRDTMAEVYSRILYLRDRQEQLQARRILRPAFKSALQRIGEDQPAESPSGSDMNPQVSIPAGESIPRPVGMVNPARSQLSTSRSRPSTLDTQQMRSRKVTTLRGKISTSRKPVSSIQIKQADYPRPPISDKEKSLKCQWCSKHFEKNETSDSDWRRHVDEDLKPYKCMAERCPDSHPCFTSFDGWFKHMQSHSQRWYQKFFPSPGWVCVVFDAGDVYIDPQSLHSHIKKFHTGQFTESQLQSVVRQSIMERPRPLKECLLCCYTVDEEPGTNIGRSKSPKRQKEQLREESSKMARMTLEMKYPNTHTSASQILDTSSSDSDASSVHRARKTCNGAHAKVIARHIAAHLQMLMVLTIRLSSLPDGNFKSDGDEANSHSVDIGDSERSSDSKDAGGLSASATDSDMTDADVADIVNNTEETSEAHMLNPEEQISEAIIDLSHIPRQYDKLDAKDDPFFQQLVRSGAFKRTRSMDDLNRAIDAANMAVDATPKDHPNRAGLLDNLGNWLGRRFDRTGLLDDLHRAVDAANMAVDTTPEDDPNRAIYLDNLGTWLGRIFKINGSLNVLDSAVEAAEMAVGATPKDRLDRAIYLDNLGKLLYSRFQRTNSLADIDRALSSYIEGWNCCAAAPSIRIRLAENAAYLLAPESRWTEASLLLEEIVYLLPTVSPNILRNTDKQHILGNFAGLASLAASAALYAGNEAYRALRLLEHGRNVIAGLMMGMNKDISDLKQQHLNLANEFIALRDKLDKPADTLTPPISNSNKPPWESQARQRRILDQQFSDILLRIRTQPGFRNFLLPPTADEMKAAADPDPIVVVNLSSYRCDAFLVERNQIRVVELPGLNLNEVKERARNLRLSGSADTFRIIPVLEWLWDVICCPVLEALALYNPISGNNWPRIWWVPTGLLNQLPLHAAGRHTQRSSETVLDRVMSSYASSVTALLHARRHHSRNYTRPTSNNALLIAMNQTPGFVGNGSLPFVLDEAERLNRLWPELQMEPIRPTLYKDDVLRHLQSCRIFHFAGYGRSDLTEPSRSCLLLEDWETNLLTVDDLRDHKLQENPPFLAYLSARPTGADEAKKLADEGIHLVSAFQLAGFRHAVGALWVVSDRHHADVAEIFYQTICKEGMTDLAVCQGLHRAVRVLRDGWVEKEQAARAAEGVNPGLGLKNAYWVPYIHFGV